MTKRKSDFTLPMNSLDELFSSQEERDDAKLERVKDIPLTELHPFKDHPFKIQNDDEMKRLIESIQKFGTLTPALARPLPEGRVRIDLRAQKAGGVSGAGDRDNARNHSRDERR